MNKIHQRPPSLGSPDCELVKTGDCVGLEVGDLSIYVKPLTCPIAMPLLFFKDSRNVPVVTESSSSLIYNFDG